VWPCGPQDHNDSSSTFQVYWCHIKLLSECLCYLLIILSLALGLRPSNRVLRLLGQSLNLDPLLRVKLTVDAQVGKRRSVVDLVKRQYTEDRLFRRASWKHGRKPARNQTQGRKLKTQRARTLVKKCFCLFADECLAA
jgi:hypothetical protein